MSRRLANVDATSHVRLTMTDIREEYLGSEKLVYGEVDGVRVVARMPANAQTLRARGRFD